MGRGGTREMDRGYERGETEQEKESDTESMEAVQDIRSSPDFNEKERERPRRKDGVSAVGRSQ